MFKFNSGQGAIICDACRAILIQPADEDDYTQAPLFTTDGEAFCNMECAALGTEGQEDDWRELMSYETEKRKQIPGVTCDDSSAEDDGSI